MYASRGLFESSGVRTRGGVAYDPWAPQNALSMRHLVHKYFKHQTDLVPAFVDEVLAPFPGHPNSTPPSGAMRCSSGGKRLAHPKVPGLYGG